MRVFEITHVPIANQGIAYKSRALHNRLIKQVVVWLAAMTLLSLFYVWTRVQVVELGYEVASLNSETKELSNKVRQKELAITKLKSLDRLETIARDKLGMKAPIGEQIVLVPETR